MIMTGEGEHYETGIFGSFGHRGVQPNSPS